MRNFGFSFLCTVFLLAAGRTVSLADGKTQTRNLRRNDSTLTNTQTEQSRSLQGSASSSPVVRTDLIRLIPFQVQIAIQDRTSEGDSQVVTETLYQGGTLLTDTITDWMVESFFTKTSNEQAEQLLVNNFTSFDSIALELVDETTNTGTIDGKELSLVQVSFEGVSLWERVGTGTPPMEPEIVELIQRATFLEDRKLKEALQTTVNNLLFDLGIDDGQGGATAIKIVDVRAYITPPGAATGNQDNGQGGGGGSAPPDGSSSGSTNNNASNANKNLEIIIIVAIVVACLAFALLIFAVIWAWRSDRQDRDDKPSVASGSESAGRKKKRRSFGSTGSSNKNNKSGRSVGNNKSKKSLRSDASPTTNTNTNTRNEQNQQSSRTAGAVSGEAPSPYDLPNSGSNSDAGSYPKVIGQTKGDDSDASGAADYPDDSVISEDISSSLTAYYKSGMGYNGAGSANNKAAGRGSGANFNDAASMSSMDSYGYSLDGYAPSLGPAQGGYPVGPMQAARDAPMPMGDGMDDIKKLQDEESVASYGPTTDEA
mmetsp:Transcript_4413/g.9574  ORF Transcript_4413/g.9574 Transcript_4413/m.9574 type:complete len:540 (+) Transcript_4413:329-1948(+)|eukprot:CAMPEP_0201121184 /NCGR_PEP_ID=MMETSP0850-20130426/5130_1 /ASSEMBLY_ACC=CAM_ASM_000622 /TAXON_ID=183588 /ORGANISM="Pseudo-nitzschia fraudulenta, Strain WWA7" /LENGTH=539 /DNA_ID=CAMNT_0047387577 /DNA_START=397 /DNA_END=2016 /DNA_ORIENTATION=+